MRQSKLTLAVMMLAGLMLLFIAGCEKAETPESADDAGGTDAAMPASQPD